MNTNRYEVRNGEIYIDTIIKMIIPDITRFKLNTCEPYIIR